jgi:hypothetical protein
MKKKILLFLSITIFLLSAGCNTQSKTADAATTTSSPDAVVENFYSDYLSYFEDPETGGFRDPLSARMYANRNYFTQELIDEIDGIVASFSEGGAYDPILCAQNIPETITFDTPYVGAGSIMFMIEDNFEDHYFFVHLEKESDGWKIGTINCDD